MEAEGAPEMMAADEMQPMMEDKPASEKAMSEKKASEKAMSEKAMSERKSTKADEDDTEEPDEIKYCLCCCCNCHCSDRHYRDLSCFGCFPVKCGVYAIGLLTIFLTLVIFAETFMMLMSDSIAWWFVFVSILLQIPLIIGLIFFLTFFGEDTKSTRSRLESACILAIVSFSLQVIWNISYFWGIYKQFNDITIGNDEAFTFTCSKKKYLFFTTLAYLLAIFAYGYFICASRRYWYRRRNDKEEGDEEETADEEKGSNKGDKEN